MPARLPVAVAAALGLVLSASPAGAQALLERGETLPIGPAAAWSLTLGALGGIRPDYRGSDDYEGFAAPLFDLRFRDRFFLSSRDGLGVSVFTGNGFSVGPLLRYSFGRDQDDNPALRGLGDVGGTVEGGGFLTWQTGGWVVNLRAVQGLNGGGHRGATVFASVGHAGRLADRWFYSVGPNVTWASAKYMDAFFGITPQQSARSGYRVYSPGAGLRDVGLGGTLTWRLTEQAAVTAIAEVSQLLDGAADSPIVAERGSATQGFLGLGLSYRFSW